MIQSYFIVAKGSEIQSMAIYLPDRVPKLLDALVLRKKISNSQIKIEDLLEIDQMHYHGIKSMVKAIDVLNIKSKSRILDIGSGYGGPARYLAWQTGSFVTALELQKEVSELAQSMTNLVGTTSIMNGDEKMKLVDRVSHIVGNIDDWSAENYTPKPIPDSIIPNNSGFLYYPLPEKYDGFMSLLALLHINDKKKLFKSIASTLKPGARFYIEDFFDRKQLSNDDKQLLSEIIKCENLPTQKEYLEALISNGFTDIDFQDVTKDWGDFTGERLQEFRLRKDSLIEIFGNELYFNLELFYSTVSTLFKNARLGGVIITGTYNPNAALEDSFRSEL